MGAVELRVKPCKANKNATESFNGLMRSQQGGVLSSAL